MGRQSSRSAGLFDEVGGPYSRTELLRLESALKLHPELKKEAVLFYLGRDWGLRPIQFALLRVADIGEDELGCYVMITRAKGKERSALRRTASNQVKRYVTAETAAALRALAESSEREAAELRRMIRLNSEFSNLTDDQMPAPLFPIDALQLPIRLHWMLRSQKLRQYALHGTSARLSQRMRSCTTILNVPAWGDDSPAQIQLGCYRFRYTKGTSMALSGASPDEVAEALDHADTTSVAHYFLFSREVIDFVNATHNSSQELRAAADAWSGRIATPGQSDGSMSTQVTDLGICKRGEVCPHHPAVSCYACPHFRPYREANHKKARDDIGALQISIGEGSSGPIKQQLKEAHDGAVSLVKFLEREANGV